MAASRPTRSPARKTKAKVKVPVKPKQPAKPKAPATPVVDPMDAAVQASADMAYGGQEQALQGQRGVNAQMLRNEDAWFNDYQRALMQATGQTQQAYGAALGVQQNVAQSSSALDATQRAQMLQGMQADAATRGATVDPQIAAQGQQAASSRRSMLDQFSALTANQGAAQTAFGANRQVVGAGQKLTALQDEAQRGRNLGTQGMELARAKGLFAVSQKAKMEDAAHQAKLEEAAFGLNVQKAQTDAEIKAASLAERRRARVTADRNADASRDIAGARLTETQRHNQTQEQIAAQRAAEKKGGRTPAQIAAARKAEQKTRSQIDTAAADARTLRGARVPVTTPDGKVQVDKDGKPTQRTRKLGESEIRAQLRKKYKDRDIANAAMDLAVKGYVDVVNQRRLKARGIRVPKEWLAKKPKAKTRAKQLLDTIQTSKPKPLLKTMPK